MNNFNKPHFCPDWDYLLIHPNDKEMDCCICGDDGVILKRGDKVKTSFYKKQHDKIRVVKECYEIGHRSQTGYFIMTTDGLNCDSAWFREV